MTASARPDRVPPRPGRAGRTASTASQGAPQSFSSGARWEADALDTDAQITTDNRVPTFPGMEPPDTVRVSLGWLRARHECNAAGIEARCHAGCCYGKRWPPEIDPQEGGACAALGPTGCTLGSDRPVTCHLYPLRHVPASDSIVRHFRAGVATSVCKGNAGVGPPLVEVLEANLRFVFGDDEYERLRYAVLETTAVGSLPFRLAPGVRERLDADHAAEALGVWPDYVPINKEQPCTLTPRRQSSGTATSG